jgi:hypothetical protein
MRVLFVMRHPGYVRNFASVLDELASRGHDVHVGFEAPAARWLAVDPLEPLHDRHSTLSSGTLPAAGRTRRALLARGLRASRDYLRYLDDAYRDAPRLRERAGRRVPRAVKSFPGVRSRPVRRGLAWALGTAERCVPKSRPVARYLDEQRPDVMLVTPLLALGSPQVDYVRAAKRRGTATALAVASWDNITNKGALHELPDAVLVWNDAQRDEAVRLLGVPNERVVVTGAQCYDHWFEQRPGSPRDEFCRRVGLTAGRPFVLYVCSSPFIAPDEVPFVRRWLAAVRAAPPPVGEVGVLVRPHPQNAAQWADVELEGAVVWPPAGDDPVDESGRADYFDSMAHAVAVVGINTSAMIEAAVVGRPVLTVLADEFTGSQRGTLHFEHIAGERGAVHVSRDLDEHVRQLADATAGCLDDERRESFVRRFVRPYGLDSSATPRFADAVEALSR